ncbi:MAG: DUF3488 and transglutaminase-like domain-containing protein [Nitriliruptorales bacterium]|nr:DUF3488 and transglutaminase-like domain-containing protein [Nitriliruptorales bacterium]
MRRELALSAGAIALLLGATHALSRVFADGSWRTPVLAAVLIPVIAAAAANQLRFGAVASAVASLLGLIVYTYVIHLPSGPLLPGQEQLAQAAALFQEGMTQIQEEPAPAPVLPGLLLVATTGVWIVSHTTHELIARARRPGLGLLPATILWAAPLAAPMPPSRTWPTAIPFLAGAALVLLLDPDVDIAAYARRSRPRVTTAGVSLGLAALAVAAAAPGMLPGYGQESWWDLTGSGTSVGYEPIVDVGDRLQLPQERPVLQVQADRKVYLRLAALETFDKNTWRLGPPGTEVFRPDPSDIHNTDGRLPFETEIATGEEIEVGITVLDLENIFLPVPYQPVEVVQGDEGMIYSTAGGFIATTEEADNEIGGRLAEGVVPGKEYVVRSLLPEPGVGDLRAADSDDATLYTQLPKPYPRFRAEAERIYEEAEASTNWDRALAIQRYFHDPDRFRYSTTEVDPLRGDDALETFVFDHRVGYCEYFSSAMAVMLRATGVPARVAVGFAPGTLTTPADPAVGRELNTYTVSTSDAHAWVEVLFPGYGWVKFDPTPRSDGNIMPPTDADVEPDITIADRDNQSQTDEPAPEEDPTAGEQPEGTENDIPSALDRDESPSSTGQSAPARISLALLGLLLLTATGAGALSLWRTRPRRPELPPAERVLAAQRRVHTIAARYGLGRHDAETAAELAERWIADGRIDPEPAREFVRLGQAAAFGGDVERGNGVRAEELAQAIIDGLRASVSRRDRLAGPVRKPAATVAQSGRELVATARNRWSGEG